MNASVQQSLKAALLQFSQAGPDGGAAFTEKVVSVFNAELDFLGKVSLLDEVFDEQPSFEELREIAFDLLLINFFTEDVQKLEEDYLASEEWEDIEEETIDRGTELLNLLLYIKECGDEGLEPELDDFLREFLLVDEDEFQDEHRIYEEVIANQILIESSLEEISRVAATLPESSELKELFYPIMAFFRNPDPDEQEMVVFKTHSPAPGFDPAVYGLLVAYNKSK